MGEIRGGEVRVAEIRVGEIRACEVRVCEICGHEVRIGEVRAAQVRVGEVDPPDVAFSIPAQNHGEGDSNVGPCQSFLLPFTARGSARE